MCTRRSFFWGSVFLIEWQCGRTSSRDEFEDASKPVSSNPTCSLVSLGSCHSTSARRPGKVLSCFNVLLILTIIDIDMEINAIVMDMFWRCIYTERLRIRLYFMFNYSLTAKNNPTGCKGGRGRWLHPDYGWEGGLEVSTEHCQSTPAMRNAANSASRFFQR